MPHRLAGQLIGSIRKVWFAVDVPLPSPGTPRADGHPPAPGHSIEIETKAGRYAHLAPAPGSGGISWNVGAAWPPTAASRRQWEDLTECIPSAFDGRPSITAVVPVDPESDRCVAREWRIELSTGVMLRCRRTRTGLDFVATRP